MTPAGVYSARDAMVSPRRLLSWFYRSEWQQQLAVHDDPTQLRLVKALREMDAGGTDELLELAASHGIDVSEHEVRADDLDELAAMISALDLVITVQGTAVHLAGATGRPVWVLLSRSCEWRYLQAGERMPWYSSARRYKQRTQNEWHPVFQQVAESLTAFRDSARVG